MVKDMRLIDADELIEFLKKVTITDGITFETGFKQILTDIKNQPTVEPVRGEWVAVEFGMFFECSNCGYLTDYKLTNYCPDCGAVMQKKVR